MPNIRVIWERVKEHLGTAVRWSARKSSQISTRTIDIIIKSSRDVVQTTQRVVSFLRDKLTQAKTWCVVLGGRWSRKIRRQMRVRRKILFRETSRLMRRLYRRMDRQLSTLSRQVRVRTKLSWRNLRRKFRPWPGKLRRQMRVRTKLSWRNFKRSPRVKWAKDNPWALVQGTLLLIVFILFAIWSNEKFGEMYNRVSEFIVSLPIALEQETILWILAILIILGIVIAAYRRGYSIPSSGSAGTFIGFLGVVALVALTIYLGYNFLRPDIYRDAPTSPPAAPAMVPGINSVGRASVILKAGVPVTISVPPGGHGWRLLEPIPKNGWTVDRGHLDEKNNLILAFNALPPITEVTLTNEIYQCANPLCN